MEAVVLDAIAGGDELGGGGFGGAGGAGPGPDVFGGADVAVESVPWHEGDKRGKK